MIIIGSDSEIMYFPPVLTLEKVLRSSPLRCVLYPGFAKRGLFSAKSGCVLYADATYTRVYTVDPAQYCMSTWDD